MTQQARRYFYQNNRSGARLLLMQLNATVSDLSAAPASSGLVNWRLAGVNA